MIQIPKDAQQVFDTVLAHARAQGCKSVGPHYFERANKTEQTCKYREGDKKCFVGCLIPDSEYDPSFEGEQWFQLVAHKLVSEDNMNLITSLQYIHDYSQPEDWEKEFKRVAKNEGLKYSIS